MPLLASQLPGWTWRETPCPHLQGATTYLLTQCHPVPWCMPPTQDRRARSWPLLFSVPEPSSLLSSAPQNLLGKVQLRVDSPAPLSRVGPSQVSSRAGSPASQAGLGRQCLREGALLWGGHPHWSLSAPSAPRAHARIALPCSLHIRSCHVLLWLMHVSGSDTCHFYAEALRDSAVCHIPYLLTW